MKLFKKAALAFAGCAAAVVLSSCASALPHGILYTGVSLPGALGNGELRYSKIGEASCTSIFGCVAVGNASINAACSDANITKVSWVTYEAVNILSLYGTYKVIVYGE